MDIYYKAGVISLIGRIEDNHTHRHHAIQVVVARKPFSAFIDNKTIQSDSIIIPANVPHRIDAGNCHTFLVEPESQLGNMLQTGLLKKDLFHLNNEIKSGLLELSGSQEQFWADFKLVMAKVSATNLSLSPDPRISQVLEYVQEKMAKHQGEDLTLAKALALSNISESRFLHLFSEQVGISWRQYLLWNKLLAAGRLALTGYNLTDSAYMAGFSDAAHLSRTFKKMFGFSPAKILQHSRFIQS